MTDPAETERLRRAFLEQRYFASLDGLRAISIVPVVWHHCSLQPHAGILGRGPLGVDLFFAISGFLITTLLVRERGRFGQIDLAAFYARRSLRIFPLYYLVFGLHLLYALFVRPDWEPCRRFLARWPYYATYTANWLSGVEQAGPALFVFAWSLCTEEQFYAFWAPVLRWSRRLSLAAGIIGAWLIVDILLEHWCGGGSEPGRSLSYRIITSFSGSIGFGALLALAIHDKTLGAWLWRLVGRRHSATVAAALVVILVASPWARTPVMYLCLALLVLCCAVRRDHGLSRLLDPAAPRFIGRISYGIYLWHLPAIGLVQAVAPRWREQPVMVFVLALPLSVGIAAVSYRFFEQRMLALGARFRRA